MATSRSRENPYSDLLYYARHAQPIPAPTILIRPYDPNDYYDEDEDEEEESARVNQYEPQTLNDFIGQSQAKNIIKTIVDAANIEKRLIPNILLTGTFGHGKTTLAKLIAKRHKKKIQIIDGAVAGAIVKPHKDTIYIIDEAHNIPSQVTDSFNILIDADNLRIIGCTTNPGALPAPFRSRFRSIYLEDYSTDEIRRIVERAAKRLKLDISKQALEEISKRSKYNPRNALTTLEFVRETAVVSKKAEIGLDVVLEALEKLEIDERGLTSVDRKYLATLTTTQPIGLQLLSSLLSIDADTIQNEIEPYLIRTKLVERTARGRLKVETSEELARRLEDSSPVKSKLTPATLSDEMLQNLLG